MRRRATDVAARLLECDPDDLEFEAGVFTVRGTAASTTLRDVAFASYDGRSLAATASSRVSAAPAPPTCRIATYPFGGHLAVVEVDVETGVVRLVDYVGVDDVGNVVNAMIVDGQVHGGVVQGIAQAMFEEVAYDDEANVHDAELRRVRHARRPPT